MSRWGSALIPPPRVTPAAPQNQNVAAATPLDQNQNVAAAAPQNQNTVNATTGRYFALHGSMRNDVVVRSNRRFIESLVNPTIQTDHNTLIRDHVIAEFTRTLIETTHIASRQGMRIDNHHGATINVSMTVANTSTKPPPPPLPSSPPSHIFVSAKWLWELLTFRSLDHDLGPKVLYVYIYRFMLGYQYIYRERERETAREREPTDECIYIYIYI
jgi:hypothetical protein